MVQVAAIQVNSSDNLNQNLQTTADLVKQAKLESARVAVLPECFALMAHSKKQRTHHAEPSDCIGPIEKFLSELAKNLDIWIIAAGIFTKSPNSGLLRNSTYVIDSSGRRVAQYDKINLFDVQLKNSERYAESTFTEPGDEVVVQHTPAGCVGLTVCYDVRFPSLFSQLIELGATWLVVPSAFAYTTGKDHWEVLLRARAIENHSYVVAPAQWGEHAGNRITYGNSMIIDPWGKVIAHKAEGDGILVADISSEKISDTRRRFGVNKYGL